MSSKRGSLSFRESLLFITNPAAFQLAVQVNSDPNQDCSVYLGPRWGTILKDPQLGKEIIDHQPVGILDGKWMRSFLGKSSALITEGDAHAKPSEIAMDFAERLRKSKNDFQQRLTLAIQEAAKDGNEMGHVLRHELLYWSVSSVISATNTHRVDEAVVHASQWLEKANCKALFLPFHRLGKGWREMKQFKKQLVEALGYATNELLASQALTIILGVVDNPVALTLAALDLASKAQKIGPIDPGEIIKEALHRFSPIPYTVRQVLKTFTVIDPKTGKPRKFRKGHGLMIPDLPFGHGMHKCLGVDLGKMIVKIALQAFPFDTHVFLAEKWGRVRFAVGFTEGYSSPHPLCG